MFFPKKNITNISILSQKDLMIPTTITLKDKIERKVKGIYILENR